MKYKFPVILAMCVASQCAPFVTEVNGEDIEEDQSLTDDAVSLLYADQLQNQDASTTSIEDLIHSEKAYLNTDTVLLSSTTGPAAASAAGSKRTAVFQLDEDDENVLIIDEEGNSGWVPSVNLSSSLQDIYDSVDITMYAAEDNTEVYAEPDSNASEIAVLSKNTEINVTGISTEQFYRVSCNGQTGYISKDKLSDHKITFASELASVQSQPVTYTWSGSILNSSNGSVIGPSGKETYYNLDMSTVVSIMRSLGFSEEDYPYWVRSDGAKMLGPYVMVAADLSAHPKGSIMSISLGQAIVCDTGGFVYNGSGTEVDVAVSW